MGEAVLLQARIGTVLVLTMNRGDKLNALDLALTEALVQAFDAADGEADVRAIVLTGAGRAFCAGADLKEFRDRTAANEAPARQRSDAMRRLYRMIPALSKPVIAAVNGFALGGGCALALACDMALAGEGARFGYPELKHGMVPAGVLPSLLHRVGATAAFDLVATGRTIDAAEALRFGMISRIVGDAEIVDEATAVAGVMAGYAPAVMSVAKSLLHDLADLSLRDGLEYIQTTDAGKQ
jgi:enoyl-CoA hydratase/carnithine racemase